MNNPLLSIIVPVYNVEKYLHRCIDSILNQTFTNFELILVNDGSTDNSRNICEEYSIKDARIIVIHKKNEGVSSARNTGLDNAKGKFITFIDSDDYISNDYLETFFIENLSKIDFIIQGIEISKNNEFIKSKIYNGYFNFDSICNCVINNNILYSGFIFGKLFRLDYINNNGIRFNKNFSFKEDLIFLLDYIYVINNVYVVLNYGYKYIIHDNGLSSRKHYFKDLYYIEKDIKNKIELINDKFNSNEWLDYNIKYFHLVIKLMLDSIYKYESNKRNRIYFLRLLKQDFISYTKNINMFYRSDKLFNLLFKLNMFNLIDFLYTKIYRLRLK